MPPWEKYAGQDSGPWAKYGKKKGVFSDVVDSFKTGVTQGMTSLAGSVSQGRPGANILDTAVGMADDIENIGRVVTGRKPARRERFSSANVPGLKTALTGAPATEDLNRVVQRTSGAYHTPETTAGRYAQSVGQMTPALAAPGSAAARVANVFLPGIAAQGAADATKALGGGQGAQDIARGVGALAGGVAAHVRLNPALTAVPRDRAMNLFLKGQDGAEMAGRAAEYRQNGIEPRLVDVVDDAARGRARVASTRQTPARQSMSDFAERRALDLPSRMGGQARRIMSQDPRTPDQMRQEIAAQRSARADQAFGAVRHEPVPITDDMVQALRTPHARAAIAEAVRRERDPTVRAALNRLQGQAFDDPSSIEMTVGMADRISRVLGGQGQAAARAGDNDLASTFSGLSRSIRNPARDVDGYRQALDDFGADSRLMEAADLGENLMTRNTDEFVQQARTLSPEERQIALASGRRAIERRAGESTSAAPGVARSIANSGEQAARNEALMGPERAGQLQQAMGLEARLVRNANEASPRAGSNTFLNQADNEAMNNIGRAAKFGVSALQGNFGRAAGVAFDWLKSRGISDADAQRVVELAMAPDGIAQAERYLAARVGAPTAQNMLRLQLPEYLGISGVVAATAQQPPQQSQ